MKYYLFPNIIFVLLLSCEQRNTNNEVIVVDTVQTESAPDTVYIKDDTIDQEREILRKADTLRENIKDQGGRIEFDSLDAN